jgi:hypothetical protein
MSSKFLVCNGQVHDISHWNLEGFADWVGDWEV